MNNKLKMLTLISTIVGGLISVSFSQVTEAIPLLDQIEPDSISYIFDTDFSVMRDSQSGDVTAFVTAVDLQLGLGNLSTSGCELSDFFGFTAGNIALIQRGACAFETKAENAAAIGAAGVLIFNQGNEDNEIRKGLLHGSLGPDYTGGIPVLSLTYDLGATFASIPGLKVHMFVDEPASAPEPSVLVLMSTALIALFGLRRRKYNAVI